jgi:hypothetical protein
LSSGPVGTFPTWKSSTAGPEEAIGLDRANLVAAGTVAEEEVEREHLSLPSCAIMRDSVVNWKLTMNQYGPPR